MPRHVVLDHHLDEVHGVYRLIVALVEDHPLPVLDANGGPVMTPDEPAMQLAYEEITVEPDGELIREPYQTRVPKIDAHTGEQVMEPMIGEDGEPVIIPGVPIQEMQPMVLDVNEVVWAADDPRWKRMKPETIAKRQREEVQAALDAISSEAEEQRKAVAKRKPLPGIGEDL